MEWPECGRNDYVNEKFQLHHRESNQRPSGVDPVDYLSYSYFSPDDRQLPKYCAIKHSPKLWNKSNIRTAGISSIRSSVQNLESRSIHIYIYIFIFIYLLLYTTIFHNSEKLQLLFSSWRHVSAAHALNKSCSFSLLWNTVVYRRVYTDVAEGMCQTSEGCSLC